MRETAHHIFIAINKKREDVCVQQIHALFAFLLVQTPPKLLIQLTAIFLGGNPRPFVRGNVFRVVSAALDVLDDAPLLFGYQYSVRGCRKSLRCQYTVRWLK